MSPHHPPRQSLAALLRSPAAASGSENTGDATGDAAADVTADTVSDAAQARSDALPAADAGIPATAAPAMATQTETVPLPAADGTPLTAAGATVEATPTFLRQHRPGPAAARWQWAVLLGLALLLLLQVVLADRARLASSATHRPWLQSLCGLLACNLPAWQEPEAFTMLERSVLPVPGQPGTLQVEASFRNDARFAQALPLIELTLSTADGQVSGQRIFSPAEYLGGDDGLALAPGQSVQARFQLVEPEPAAEAFHFRFR